MSWRASLATFALLAAAALLLFHLFQREIAGSWLAFGVHPQVLGELESSLADQKRLARAGRRLDRLRLALGELAAGRTDLVVGVAGRDPAALCREDLGALVSDFEQLFGFAWPNLTIRAERPAKAVVAAVDREMIRQVWVNLLENAAQACGDRRGRVVLAISRKILLDHGGDLELIESGPRGARFRLALPRPQGTG